MFTWGSKYLFGVAAASLLGAAVYGLVTGGGPIGVISVGYKGGVGEHIGYAVLTAIGAVAFLLGVLNLVTRDGDATAAAAAVGTDQVLAVATPRSPSYWGPLGAFGAACLAVGVAVSQPFFILGIAVISVVALEWVVLAWSDRATGDPEVNSAIRGRVLRPLEIPLLALIGFGAIVLGLSRVLLAVPEAGSVAVASVVAAGVFAAAVAIAKSNAPRSVITGVIAVGAVAVLAGGIVAAAVGEREISHGEDGEHAEETSESGAAVCEETSVPGVSVCTKITEPGAAVVEGEGE